MQCAKYNIDLCSDEPAAFDAAVQQLVVTFAAVPNKLSSIYSGCGVRPAEVTGRINLTSGSTTAKKLRPAVDRISSYRRSPNVSNKADVVQKEA